MATARQFGPHAGRWQPGASQITPTSSEEEYENDGGWGDEEWDPVDHDEDEEYENKEDIEAIRRGLPCYDSSSSSSSSSMPNSNTFPAVINRHPGQLMMKNKAQPPPPPRNKPNKKHSYLELVDESSSNSSTASDRLAVNFGHFQAHSDLEPKRSPHLTRLQQQNIKGINSQNISASLPSGMSLISAKPRMPVGLPANTKQPLALSPSNMSSVPIYIKPADNDEPPTERAPAPPPDDARHKNRPGVMTPKSPSSGFVTPNSGTTSPTSARTGREKSPPNKSHSRCTKEENLRRFSWYKDSMNRKEAEKKVLDYRQDGSFIVRTSRNAGPNKPFVMTILCSSEIFHVPIRRRTDSHYAVGEEKSDELVFDTVEDVIKHFHLNPIDLVLTDSRKHSETYKTTLKYHKS